MNPVISPFPIRRESIHSGPTPISSTTIPESSVQNTNTSPASDLDKKSAAQLVEVYRSNQLSKEISAAAKSDIEKTYDAQKFHSSIHGAKNSGTEEDIRNKTFGTKDSKWYGAAVHTYPVEEYSKMKLFLSSNELCGFALKDVDVVSVFKHRNETRKALDLLMPKAIAEGGRRLDCFDINTALPFMYAKYGFKPVAKVKFEPKEAPEDWNYSRDGNPDIIFMVYNKIFTENSEKNPVQLKLFLENIIAALPYCDYDDAIKIQQDFLNHNK